MSKILIGVEVNVLTGEIVERELSEVEVLEIQNEQSFVQAEADAKASARESALAKLAALGLTPEEIAAL